MNAIDFATRTPAGTTNFGSVGGDGQTFVIAVGTGEEISLNLRQSDLRGYDRAGNDLLITLADGRVIVIEGYFGAGGAAANRLFLSAEGQIAEVSFEVAEGDALYASYGPAEGWGKWSASDDLIFVNRPEVVADLGPVGDEDVSMLAAGLLGGSGLGAIGAGGAALVGAGLIGFAGDGGGGGNGGGDNGSGGGNGGGDNGSGGGNGGGGPVVPTITTPDDSVVIGGGDAPIITVSGTGVPTSDVAVTIGDETETTTVDEDGTWTVEFEGEDFPADGDYVVDAVVTDPDGTVTDVTGPNITIDTTPPLIDVEAGTESVGDIVNAEDHADGTTVSGTVEPGASVVVTVGEAAFDATVDADGGWTITFDDTVMPGGEYTEAVTITATDAAGNSTVITDAVEIDTVPHPITIDPVGGDNLVNGADSDAGFEITGTSTAGAVVSVVFGDMTHEVTTGDDGVWSVIVSSADFSGGEYTTTITASTVDAAGNASATTSDVDIDTVGNVALDGTAVQGDDLVNAVEHAAGTTFSGTSEAGSAVTVTVEGTTLDATVAVDGAWSVTFGPGDIAPGTYSTEVVVTATDAAGNTSSTSQAFAVDTDISGGIDDGIAGDGLINADEAAAGLTITGTAEAGASVVVSFQSVEYTTTATDTGTWSVSVPPANIAPGVYDATVGMIATDAAGNAQVADAIVQVDTSASVTFDAGAVGGDGTVNAVEHAAGVTLTGTTQPGSTVTVEIAGQSHAASVASDGVWNVALTTADLPQGTTQVAATVTAVSQAGNSATTSGSFEVDTEVDLLAMSDDPVTADNVINAAEAAQGITLTGVVEAGSHVQLTIGGVVHTAAVDAAGNWTVDIPGSSIPDGTVDAPVLIEAVDAAGNTRSEIETISVDTEAPGAIGVQSYTRDHTGLRGISITLSDDTVEVGHVVDTAGNVSIDPVGFVGYDMPALGETSLAFTQNVPDGSHLVITSTDAAGNSSGTYLVLDDTTTSVVDMTAAGTLGQFQIETIDLQFAEDSQLTITEAQLLALSSNNDTVTIEGGIDDTVTITGATLTGTTTGDDGQGYNVYELGAGTLLIEDDISNVVI